MKRGKKNYVCIKDCGKIDPTSKTISKADKSLLINLLGSKNKREDNVIHKSKLQMNYHRNTRNKESNNEVYQNVRTLLSKNLIITTVSPCEVLKLSLARTGRNG